MKTTNLTNVRMLTAAAVATILIVGAGMAMAQGSGRGKCAHQGDGGFGPGHRMEMMAERLELTEEQQATITKLHEDASAAQLESRKEIMRLENELEGELMKDEPGTKTVAGLVEKIGDLRTQQQQTRMATRLAVREQLTPEQQDKMLMVHKGGRGHGRHGKGMSRGHGCDNDCGKAGGRGHGGRQGDGRRDNG